MFKRLPSLLLIAGIAASYLGAVEPAPAPPLPSLAERRDLVQRVERKSKDHQRAAEAFAPELAEFDRLLAKYHKQPEDAAAVLLDRSFVTLRNLRDEPAAKALCQTLLQHYPGTKAAERAKRLLHEISPEGKAEFAAWLAERKAKLDALIGHTAPDIEIIWSSRAGLSKLTDLSGRVVVLDFWATWCGPCIASFPKVREEVTRFRNSPVSFLGVTSLQGKVHGLEAKPVDVKDDAVKEFALTADFMKKHDMTWDVVFSKQSVFNPDYVVQGIPSIVIIAPDGKVRHAALNPHTPGVDIGGKITEILREFNLPVPATKI